MKEVKEKYLRKLKAKARQTRKDYEETEKIYNLAKTEFVNEVLIYCEKHKTPSPLTSVPQDKEALNEKAKEVFSEKEVKDVYKKIAISTHPDKLINLEDEDKEQKTALFKKAAKAKGARNLTELTEIASELKINLRDLRYTQLELLEQQIQEKEQEIGGMREDIAWKWYYMNLEQRRKIIAHICSKENS